MDTIPMEMLSVENEGATKLEESNLASNFKTKNPLCLTPDKMDVEKPKRLLQLGSQAVKPKIQKAESKKLRKKLLETEQRNQTLAESIAEKNQEITALKCSVDSLNEVLNSVPLDELRNNSSIASTKIVELSKKNRLIRAEVEQLKHRLTKKDIQIEKLEKELKSNEEKLVSVEDQAKKSFGIDELHAKINSMKQKLFESRNKNTELQNQLKLAQKCLQHEVGETVNINILANNLNQATWRGRAQQIISLQQKLQELKERLENYENRVDHAEYVPMGLGSELNLGSNSTERIPARTTKSVSSLGRTSSSATLGAGDSGVASFDRFTPGVRKNEIVHRAKVEAFEKQVAALQSQLEEQSKRSLALKVRNKTLSDELLRYKTRCLELEELNNGNDLNAASTLNEKMNRQRNQFEMRIDEIRNDVMRITEERDIAKRQMDELSAMNLELMAELKLKEQCIKDLEEELKKMETDMRALTGGFLFSCREFRKDEFVGILDALEVEKNQTILMSKKLDERLEAERAKNEASADKLAKQKIRIVRLEVKVRDLEKELEAQNDRKKRTQRINEYANSVGRYPLTGSISSFNFDHKPQCDSMPNIAIDPILEDMKDQLELANEKVIFLTEKLKYLTAEKCADAKFFEKSLLNSKTIILDTILGAKSASTKNTVDKAVETVTENA